MKQNSFKFKWPLVGNSHIIEYLSKNIINNNIQGTYIFSGPDNLGKSTVAKYFAMSLLCDNNLKNSGDLPCGICPSCKQFKVIKNKKDENNNENRLESIHGDFYLIEKSKDKKNISIDEIRNFINSLNMSSFLNSYKIGIIKHAELLSNEAANALLKTLEEPKVKVLVILITSNHEMLPATILSRGSIIKFNPVARDTIYNYLIKEYKASRSTAHNFSQICAGRPALAVKFLENKKFYENYIKKAKILLDYSRNNIIGRFGAINEIIGQKTFSQESLKSANRTIEIWQGLIRDLLLLKLDQKDLVQHLPLLKELSNLKNSFTIKDIIDFSLETSRAKKYLNSNVSPKLILENISANII